MVPLCGGFGAADGQADGSVAEVGDEVQAAVEGPDAAGEDLDLPDAWNRTMAR